MKLDFLWMEFYSGLLKFERKGKPGIRAKPYSQATLACQLDSNIYLSNSRQ